VLDSLLLIFLCYFTKQATSSWVFSHIQAHHADVSPPDPNHTLLEQMNIERRKKIGFFIFSLLNVNWERRKWNVSMTNFCFLLLLSFLFTNFWFYLKKTKRRRLDFFFKKNWIAEPPGPAGLPVFSGSQPVRALFPRFSCCSVLQPNRTGCRSGSQFDRSGFNNLGFHARTSKGLMELWNGGVKFSR
jgi:amino acid transporter